MARKAGKKRMTLSEHLALHAQAAEEAAAKEEARARTIQRLRELDAMATCTCPACVAMRQKAGRSQG